MSDRGKSAAPRATRGRRKSAKSTDYDVGYKKPPKKTRFKKGQSGNPHGRKKVGSFEDARIVVENVFSEPVQVKLGNKARIMTNIERAFRVHQRNALAGNPPAVRSFFKLMQKMGLFSQVKDRSYLKIVTFGDYFGRFMTEHEAARSSSANDRGTGSDV